MAKLRLFVKVRKQGSRIESVPLKRLEKLSGYNKKRWEFKDGWLILEAFWLSRIIQLTALKWRAFSVSGQFRKALSDLISYLHNSNKKLVQITLTEELLPEERFFVLGFVPIEIVKLKENVWFTLLDSNQINSLSSHFAEMKSKFCWD